MTFDKKKVIKWMRRNKDGYIDNSTGEINYTGLAEAAALEFSIYEDKVNYNIPEEVFELALEVDEAA